MEAVLGLMVILLGVSHGVETHCDGRQDGAQCYGALGGTVDIQLMGSTSEIPRYQLLKNSLKILDVRNNYIVIYNTIAHRSSFFPSNGTFRINNLSRNDSGDYTLETSDSDGASSGVQTLQLFIQAPVSSVLLVSECLSQGEMRVSCSSEGGDSPQYSWALDGRTLTDAELLSGNNKSNNIILKQQVSGHLVCSVRNHVNSVSKEQKTCSFINCTSINGTQILGWVHADSNSLCIEPTTEPTPVTLTAVGTSWFIIGLKAAVVILSLSGIWIWFTWKKKTILEGPAVPEKVESPDNSVFMIEMSPCSNT
ncbi:hemicentin-2-like [Simochromis diagramma]|uniref:hemicentin-2-like n=1 Tax=Simochromis diagramma TaxID=43689 RepID=UPI001A7F0B85|nr:hemicentin-2-like [Simochromis diagramma]